MGAYRVVEDLTAKMDTICPIQGRTGSPVSPDRGPVRGSEGGFQAPGSRIVIFFNGSWGVLAPL